MANSLQNANIDLSKPRYDQSTYRGRAKHFFETTNPMTIFASNRQLAEAAQLVNAHKRGEVQSNVSEDELWRAKALYDSAYHPDSGEKMFLLGRMSFQVPGNMTIIGLMLTFYKSTGAVIFWQFANQTFNAIVNYTNRSGGEVVSTKQILLPYVLATSAATLTALTLNNIAKKMPPLVGRFVPFIAVGAANSINIPLMRQKELKEGVQINDKNDNVLGLSTNAATKGIAIVVLSRILMASPGMVIPPLIMNSMESRGVFKKVAWLRAPFQVCLVGLCLSFATPLGCALFPQNSSMTVEWIEDPTRSRIQQEHPSVKMVYFNKGL